MIDCLTLRYQLVSLLAGLLGQYHFSDGTTGDAIAILPDDAEGFNYPGNGTETEGIECVVIRPYPTINSLLGGDRIKPYRWQVTLKQWNPNGSLLDAVERLVNNLDYSITSPSWVPPNAALGIIEQVRFEVLEFEFQKVT